MTKMKVMEGAGVNANTMRLIVEKDEEVLFDKKYYCGYDYSWDRLWATEKEPFKDDLINDIKEKYEVDEVEYEQDKRAVLDKRNWMTPDKEADDYFSQAIAEIPVDNAGQSI